MSKKSAPYLFIAPFFALFILFWLWPLFYSIFLSFADWNGVGSPAFIGIKNFLRLISDDIFRLTIRNTFFITVAGILINLPLAMLFAVLLNSSQIRFRAGFRLAIFLPVVMSFVIASMIFLNLLDYNAGLFKYGLERIGITMPDLLSSDRLSIVALMAIVLWRWTGYNMLFFIAGLQNIPAEIIEAAKIDGAGTARLFFRITLPMLKPVTVFVVVQSIIGSFQIFEEPLIITGGGPAFSSMTMALYLYNKAFRSLSFGYASAISVVQFGIILGLSLLALNVTGALRRE